MLRIVHGAQITRELNQDIESKTKYFIKKKMLAKTLYCVTQNAHIYATKICGTILAVLALWDLPDEFFGVLVVFTCFHTTCKNSRRLQLSFTNFTTGS